MKVLVVDDSRFFREQLKDILGELGYSDIVEASNGREALKKINEVHVGLVFLDIEMPLVNGIQVLNTIRNHPTMNDIPVIMVTQHSGKKNIMEAIKAGASSYVVKPVKFHTIYAKLIQIGVIKKLDP